jgi:hypothetical protein
MIEDTIAGIESRLAHAQGLSAEQRAELQGLVAQLKAELVRFSATNSDQARSIAGYVDLSTHEISRAEKHPGLLNHAVAGLSYSVAGLETQHPRLTATINAICAALANSGI